MSELEELLSAAINDIKAVYNGWSAMSTGEFAARLAPRLKEKALLVLVRPPGRPLDFGITTERPFDAAASMEKLERLRDKAARVQAAVSEVLGPFGPVDNTDNRELYEYRLAAGPCPDPGPIESRLERGLEALDDLRAVIAEVRRLLSLDGDGGPPTSSWSYAP